jgi:glycosyltransferase involved in cell wall biosynthesis
MNGAQEPVLTVVSKSFPPQVSGSTILLANLLSHYAGTVNAFVGQEQLSKVDYSFLVPCPTRHWQVPAGVLRVYDALRRRVPAVPAYSLCGMIRCALRHLGTQVVLGAFPREDFFVAAFLAARQLRLPFYAHMHDLWLENLPPGTPTYRFAQHWEPRILRQAARVLCMTEAMQRHYVRRYQVQTDLLPHSIPDIDVRSAVPRPPHQPKPTVLFVGAVNPAMNLDALQVLAAASELLPPDYDLLYCTPSDSASLARLGIHSSRLRATYVSRAEVQRLQTTSHVLIAPLSHKNCSADEVRTVFSTKLLEYLIAGRPIIVFAPADSYHAISAQQHGWAYVVTEDSPEALARAIVRVTTDETLAATLVQGALKEGHARRATRQAEVLREWVWNDVYGHSAPELQRGVPQDQNTLGQKV